MVQQFRPDLIQRARQLIEAAGLICVRAYCALEAKPPAQWNKGRGAMYILRTVN
jgi:trehalose 6-phosphate synthase/phosphatase